MREKRRRRRGLLANAVRIAAATALVAAGASPASPASEGEALAPADRPALAALGPAPRGEDGRFTNRAGPLDRAGPSVTLPFFLRRIAARFGNAPEGLPPVVENDGRAFRHGRGANPSVTWVGHATLLVRMAGMSFLTDPIWSGHAGPARFAGARRYLPPGIALEALPRIDFVVISHNHYDHLDVATLARLAERDARTVFVVPLGNGATLREAGIERVVELDWGETVPLGPLVVACLPAQHWSKRGLLDDNRALWASWAVLGPERRFYFAGDTGWFGGFRETGRALAPFDLAAVPIGAYEPEAMMRPSHLDPEEAVRAALAVGARRMLAIHYGTFDLSDEPVGEPPRRFRAAAREAGVDDADAWTLAVGETRHF